MFDLFGDPLRCGSLHSTCAAVHALIEIGIRSLCSISISKLFLGYNLHSVESLKTESEKSNPVDAYRSVKGRASALLWVCSFDQCMNKPPTQAISRYNPKSVGKCVVVCHSAYKRKHLLCIYTHWGERNEKRIKYTHWTPSRTAQIRKTKYVSYRKRTLYCSINRTGRAWDVRICVLSHSQLCALCIYYDDETTIKWNQFDYYSIICSEEYWSHNETIPLHNIYIFVCRTDTCLCPAIIEMTWGGDLAVMCFVTDSNLLDIERIAALCESHFNKR